MVELQEYEMYHARSKLEKSLNTLKGIIQGISLDGVITQNEINELVNWCSLQAPYRDNQPYVELLPLIEAALADNIISDDECQDILWVCNNFVNRNVYFDAITASVQQLHGIIHGVLADNRIDDAEITRLSEWIRINDFLRGTYPFDEIESLLTAILADHHVSDSERLMLKAFLGDFVDTRDSLNINLPEIEGIRMEMQISGLCAVCPDIIFADRSFCFTGESQRAGRKELASIVEERNGVFSNSVTKNTNYLIVGGNGNPCWAFSCYGRKVEKAVELRKKGVPISIVHENDFWDVI